MLPCDAFGTELSRLRRVAAAVCHVPALDALVFERSGSNSRIVTRSPVASEVAATDFRLAVAEAVVTASLRPVSVLLGFGHDAGVGSVLGPGTDELQPRERGIRWRKLSPCRTTDYVVTEMDASESAAVAGAALRPVVAEPDRWIRARHDDELHMTVLAVDRPTSLREDEEVAFDQALQDLAVMCRVRANLDRA